MIIREDKTLLYNYSLENIYDINFFNHLKCLKERFGFRRMTFCDNKWRFSDMEVAVAIKEKIPAVEIDSPIQMVFELAKMIEEDARIAEENAIKLKAARVSNLEVKNIKGNLFPYQKLGVEFFINNNGRGLLADQMGVGKTLQSLAYVAHSEFKKILIISPALVKYNWKKEVEKWTSLEAKVINSTDGLEDLVDKLKSREVFIINYDILKKFIGFLTAVNWDVVIADECHALKSPRAKRTKLATKIIRKIPRVLLLSGTPFLSRPAELFTSLNIIDPKNWGDYYSYSKRYCEGHQGRYGWDDRGASNIPELQQRISTYFLRRTKDDVLPDLPKKLFVNIPVVLSNDIASQYKLAEEEFGKYLIKVKKKTLGEVKKALQAEKLAKLGALRQLTTKGKFDSALEIIENILDSGEKVVVFSCYNEPLETLHKKFKNISVLLTGSVDAKTRGEIVDKFQADKNCRIFFGGIKSAGVGITLTSATNVLFIDFSWTPADHAQAADRIHRISATADHVTIYQLYSKGTIDEFMYNLLEKKQKLFDQLIEGKDVKISDNYTASIMSSIERRHKNKKLDK